MKMFSDCSGPCETCANFYASGSCMAGHGDDHYFDRYDLEQRLKYMRKDDRRRPALESILVKLKSNEKKQENSI